jgi:hypothetical protein
MDGCSESLNVDVGVGLFKQLFENRIKVESNWLSLDKVYESIFHEIFLLRLPFISIPIYCWLRT